MKTYFLFTTLLLLFGSQPLSCFAQGNISPDRQKDLQRQYQMARKAIKHESERLRINDLSNVTLTDEIETRLWIAFGEAYPRCLILKKSKTDNTASLCKGYRRVRWGRHYPRRWFHSPRYAWTAKNWLGRASQLFNGPRRYFSDPIDLRRPTFNRS